MKSLSQNYSLNLFEFICDFKFEKEQKLLIEMKINNNQKVLTHNIQTSIGEIIGNENKDKNGIKLYDLLVFNEKLKIKSEKIKTNIQFVLIHLL